MSWVSRRQLSPGDDALADFDTDFALFGRQLSAPSEPAESQSLATAHRALSSSHPQKRWQLPLWMRWKEFWGVVTIILAILIVSVYNLTISDAAFLVHLRESVVYLSRRHAADIARQVRTSTSSLQALEGIIQIDAYNTTILKFDRLADTLIRTYKGISNLQLAPFGTIGYIYPLVDETQDNRAAIGHSLLLDPSRREAAREAIVNRATRVVGPLKLMQGGTAAIARRPVFSRYAPPFLPDEWYVANGVNYTRSCSDPGAQDPDCSYPGPLDVDGFPTFFWGFAVMLTTMEDILANTELKSLETGTQDAIAGINRFAFELSDPNPHASLADVGGIWKQSSHTQPLIDPVQVDVMVEEFGLHWTLRMAPADGWPVVSQDFWRQLLLVLPLTALLGTFLGVTIIMGLRRHALKLQDLGKYVKTQKETAICNAVLNLNAFQFPMYLVKANDFTEMGQLTRHETAREMGKLCCFDLPEDVAEISNSKGVVFMSHQWAGFEHPDPEGVQYRAMLVAIEELKTMRVCCGFIWLDYTCIPQLNQFLQQAAINSLAVYASFCSVFVSVAPECQHVDTGMQVDIKSYQARAWCRLELLSYKSSINSSEHVAYICDGCTLSSWEGSLSVTSVLHVLGGSFTCCARKHPGNMPCDRKKIQAVMLGLYWRLKAIRRDREALLEERGKDDRGVGEGLGPTSWQDRMLSLIEADKDKYFPPRTLYRTETGEEKVELFEGYIDILHELFEADTNRCTQDRLPVLGLDAAVPAEGLRPPLETSLTLRGSL